jgi:hypothetical protein
MIETLYKTESPEKGRSECYTLVLTPRPASNCQIYSFMEEHGKWDDSLGRFVHEVTAIITDEEMGYETASTRYHTAKMNLAKKGFVHSFAPGRPRKELHSVNDLRRELIGA